MVSNSYAWVAALTMTKQSGDEAPAAEDRCSPLACLSDAAKRNLREICREMFSKCDLFKNWFATRDLARFLCIEWRFPKHFQVFPSEGGCTNLWNLCFFGLFPFVFDLVRCLSSWWMVERVYQNNKKKQTKRTAINDSNYWFCFLCLFLLVLY